MFANLGPMEILLILVVVLLLFGAKRLPEIGAAMGKGIRDFKRSLSDTERAISDGLNTQSDRLPRGDVDKVSQQQQRQEEEVRPEPKRLL